jgi:hypothetical protein
MGNVHIFFHWHFLCVPHTNSTFHVALPDASTGHYTKTLSSVYNHFHCLTMHTVDPWYILSFCLAIIVLLYPDDKRALWLFESLGSAMWQRITLLKALNTWVGSLYTHVQTCKLEMYSFLHLKCVLPQACVLLFLRSGSEIEQVLKERSLSCSVKWSPISCYWCVTRSVSQEITRKREELMRCVYLVWFGVCACNPPQKYNISFLWAHLFVHTLSMCSEYIMLYSSASHKSLSGILISYKE